MPKKIKCSKCGRELEYLGSPMSMFGPSASVLGASDSMMNALEQWRGNVCMDCRLILCPDCITVGFSAPCPNCGQPTMPAQWVYVEQALAPASAAKEETAKPRPIYHGAKRNYSQLMHDLKELVTEANKWGMRNGYPLFEKYPQYDAICEIGQILYDMGGDKQMEKAYMEVYKQITYPGMSRYWWDGIGGWWA
ncbi:MAG: hypothetical protein PHO15_06070 [Eubacteriales bacterium]|nr:hypothetical protein [Eubacteriales bacterium]